MTVAFMRAVLAGDAASAEAELGATLPSGWPPGIDVLPLYLRRLEDDPAGAEWLMRAIVLPGNPRQMAGNIGFHLPPDHEGCVEIGYTVEPAFRGRGYATEAARALVRWAVEERGVRAIVATTLPDNLPSQKVLEAAGFVRTGRRWDDDDQVEELVFELMFSQD
jgi:RimJ/RimL family protein N-acetyltransferase